MEDKNNAARSALPDVLPEFVDGNGVQFVSMATVETILRAARAALASAPAADEQFVAAFPNDVLSAVRFHELWEQAGKTKNPDYSMLDNLRWQVGQFGALVAKEVSAPTQEMREARDSLISMFLGQVTPALRNDCHRLLEAHTAGIRRAVAEANRWRWIAAQFDGMKTSESVRFLELLGLDASKPHLILAEIMGDAAQPAASDADDIPEFGGGSGNKARRRAAALGATYPNPNTEPEPRTSADYPLTLGNLEPEKRAPEIDLPTEDEAAAHMYPTCLEWFKEGERTGEAYSIKMGNTAGQVTQPLYTLDQMRAAVLADRRLTLERAAQECEKYEKQVCESRKDNRAQHFMGAAIGASACADRIRAVLAAHKPVRGEL